MGVDGYATVGRIHRQCLLQVACNGAQAVADLDGQLAGRHQHQYARLALCGLCRAQQQALQRGQAVRQCLARTGGRADDGVLPAQQDRNGLQLDGTGRCEIVRAYRGGMQGRGQTQRGQGHG